MKRFFFVLTALFVTPAAAQNYAPGALTANNCAAGVTLGAATAATVIPANTVSHGWRLENLSTTEALWWSVTATATIATTAPNTSGSFALAAGTATTFAGAGTAEPGYGFATGGALSIIATSASHPFACLYW